jgi:hypothetical protein
MHCRTEIRADSSTTLECRFHRYLDLTLPVSCGPQEKTQRTAKKRVQWAVSSTRRLCENVPSQSGNHRQSCGDESSELAIERKRSGVDREVRGSVLVPSQRG